jgi:hypothetical protein
MAVTNTREFHMFSSQRAQRIALGFGTLVAGLAVSTSAFAGTASAEPIGPNGPAPKAGHCPVVNTDSNGNETVEYVPTGTRYGLMFCGSDGEWHTGWLVDDVAIQEPTPPTGGTTRPPVVGNVDGVFAQR